MGNLLLTPSQTAEDSGPSTWTVGARTAGLSRSLLALQALVLIGLLIPVCAPIFGDLVNLWWTRYGFSHGFLVPLISLYFVRLLEPVLRQIPVAPALGPGVLWLMVSTALLVASEAGSVLTTGSVALILLLAGLVLLLCGYGYLKALAFPLAYLIFMTPALDLLTEPLEWPFQLLTAGMSVSLLQALGVPVWLENQIFIMLPTVTLEVTRECSGAGLLVAVLAVGLPLAALTLRAWWSRITLVVAAVLIAIVSNWLRLAVMGLYAHAGGKELHGPYHILQGLFVDWVAFAFLFIGAWCLSRIETAAPPSTPDRALDSPRPYSVHPVAWTRAWWLATLTLAAATLLLYSLDRGTTPLKKDLAAFPSVVGEWVVDRVSHEESPVGIPDADHSLARTYRTLDGRRLHLSIAYLNTQRQGKELVGPATAALHERAVAIDLRVGAVPQAVNRTVIEKRHRPIPAVFWYQIDGAAYADRAQAKLATITQAFRRGRIDGALVLVSAETPIGPDEEQWKVPEEFARALFPLLREFLP